MMRKLTLAATLAAAAIATMAAAAPAANANEDFYVTSNDNQLCPWNGCPDTGYDGELEFVTAAGQLFNICDVSYDINVYWYGEISLVNHYISNCQSSNPLHRPYAEPCGTRSGYPSYPTGIYAPGQITWPDDAPPTQVQIEVPICYGIGSNDYVDRVVFNPGVSGGQRTWTQVSAPGTTYMSNIDNAAAADTYGADNVKVILGTP